MSGIEHGQEHKKNARETVDTSRAAGYWNQVLDPNNLDPEASAAAFDPAAIRREVALAATPDLAAARIWLTANAEFTASADIPSAIPHAACRIPHFILDLGAGLGAAAFVMAGAGHTILAVDTSPARLRALRERARRVGLESRIRLVVGSAEALPFAAGSVPALYTKSVLIHTRPEASAAEIARALAPGGRAALVEPGTRNPFVNLYRATLAPRAWRGITRYFTPEIESVYLTAPGVRPGRPPVLPFYFFSFFAFAFVFAWPHPPLFRLALRLLGAVDALLFRLIPPLRRLAWFRIIRLERPQQS